MEIDQEKTFKQKLLQAVAHLMSII